MIFPSAGAHGARQDRIKRDRDAARKADLAAMGMAAQQEIEVGMGSLPIHFRRVRDQNRKLVVGYRGSRLLDVVHSVEMGIVDAAEMKALAAALNNVALVEQHPYSHRLQSRHHANRVVIAEHAVDWALEAGTYARHSGERCVVRTAGSRPGSHPLERKRRSVPLRGDRSRAPLRLRSSRHEGR